MSLKNHKVFYGWWIVGILLVISAYLSGIIYYGFTALIEPVVEEFGWSYTQVSFAMSLRGMEAGILAPLVGFLIDRFNSRKLLFSGIIICGLGLFALSRVTTLGQFYAVFVLIASGLSACTGILPVTVVGNWFRRNVSIATGIVVCGSAFGGLLIPAVTSAIDTFGWRMAMVIFAVVAWIVFLPISLLVRHRPEDYGYLPDGDTDSEPVNDENVTPTTDVEATVSIGQAIKSRVFWHISLTFICHMLVVGGVLTHVMPYMGKIGIARSVSSFLASGIMLMTIVGRVGFGWLGDRYDKKRITAIAFLLLSSALLLYSYIGVAGIWLVVIFLIIFGIGYGGPVTMLPALVREYFGRGNLGTILGLAYGLASLGSIAGPPLAGWVFDTFHSYQIAWLIFIGITIIGMVSIITCPPLNALKMKTASVNK
jgi:sugar phosphate permease